MPEFSLPFDSIAGDEREYPAEQFVQYLKPLINTGIHTDPDTLKVEHVDGMTLQVNTGYAWLEGYVYSLYDVPLQLTLEQAHGSLDRIDRIVIRLDLTLPVRSINAKILKGEPSSNPEPPALTRDANVYELSLAQVRVVGGQNFIDPANITDERGDEEFCPWITSNILPDITDALQDVIDQLNDHIGSGGTAHALATTSQAGFMDGGDKKKLEYVIPSNTVILENNGTITWKGSGASIDRGFVRRVSIVVPREGRYRIRGTVRTSDSIAPVRLVLAVPAPPPDGQLNEQYFIVSNEYQTTSTVGVTFSLDMNVSIPRFSTVFILCYIDERSSVDRYLSDVRLCGTIITDNTGESIEGVTGVFLG